jgi:hypothetical protein
MVPICIHVAVAAERIGHWMVAAVTLDSPDRPFKNSAAVMKASR